MAEALVNLSTDQSGRVECRMDVRVREALPHRGDELGHLAGGDPLAGRADDVGRHDVALDHALGGRARRLVAPAAQERAYATGHALLAEVDVREERVALGRLEALVAEHVVDRVTIHDLGLEAATAGSRL